MRLSPRFAVIALAVSMAMLAGCNKTGDDAKPKADAKAEAATADAEAIPGLPTDEGGALGAMRYFENGGAVPLMAKAERKSSVHRRVPRQHPDGVAGDELRLD